MHQHWKYAVLATFAITATASSGVHAQAIFTAQSAVVDAGGTEASANIAWTHNQAGLFTGYTADVTDFDTYIAGNPLHTIGYIPNEWFSAGGSTSVVTYDFGFLRVFDRFALWNEEFSGIGSLDILGSTDGVTFSSILTGLTPPNSPQGVDYGATVWSFAATNARYFRMEMSQCPQADAFYNGCSIGEVAFRAANVVVPEPASVAMMGVGLVALAGIARRRRSA